MSWQLTGLNLWLRLREKPIMSRETDPVRARARLARVSASLPMPPGFDRQPCSLSGVLALRLATTGSAGTIFYLHGGAYCLGAPETHAALAAALARRAGTDALLPDYRLAPEHRFPAAPDDVLGAWRGLVETGADPARTVLAGDSAGGGLALALLHRILAAGLPPPACAVLFSPWTDLTLSGDSLRRLAIRDVLLPARRLPEIRDLYLGGADPADPVASPLFGQFAGAPPVLIQASRAEILLDDATRMAARLEAEGVTVSLDLWDAPPHVWQFYQGGLPEADVALDRAAEFIRRHLPA